MQDVELAIKGKFDAVLDTIGVPETERIGINFLKRGGHYMTLQARNGILFLLSEKMKKSRSHNFSLENLEATFLKLPPLDPCSAVLQGEAASLTDRYGLAVGLPVATAILLKKQIQYRSSHGIGMENLCITSYFE